jgi:DNA primase
MNVEELLVSKKIPYIPRGKDFVVSCLNPEHPDRNPSMRIDQVTGIFNCFSCEYKGNLFSHFGEKVNQMDLARSKIKKKISDAMFESVGLQFPENYMPYLGNWRNIKPETYKKFKAFQHPAKEFASRIVFPIYDRTERVVAFVGRATGVETPKYLNSPAGAKMPLFPVVTPINGSIILVEGIFDMLNLHDKGLTNAVCCFGVKNINNERLSILAMQGVDNIDIFLDNDEAGQTASEKVKGLCEEVGLNSRNIKFGNKQMDAGALTETQVQKLRSKLYA